MKKLQIVSFIIFITQFIVAQNSFKITYKAYPKEGSIEKSEKVEKSKLKYLYQDVDDAISTLRFDLEIDNKNILFKTQDIIFHNERALRLAKSYTNSNDEYYFNITSNKNIENNEKINWTITNESKKIDSLLCYKATTIRESKIKNETKFTTIEAWFCPSISIPYGPKGYHGLPGLIVEIIDDKTSMIIEKISKNTKAIVLPEIKNVISKN
jgi:GLPGLI family protein